MLNRRQGLMETRLSLRRLVLPNWFNPQGDRTQNPQSGCKRSRGSFPAHTHILFIAESQIWKSISTYELSKWQCWDVYGSFCKSIGWFYCYVVQEGSPSTFGGKGLRKRTLTSRCTVPNFTRYNALKKMHETIRFCNICKCFVMGLHKYKTMSFNLFHLLNILHVFVGINAYI